MLTDGGLETTLIFHDGIALPNFAAFDQLRTIEGRAAIKRYYLQHASIAVAHKSGFILDAPTWRASRDWGKKMGYSTVALDRVNRDAIELLVEIRNELETPTSPMVVAGDIGPRGDGYAPGNLMTPSDACDYHCQQIETFALTQADMITALTINAVGEAIGIANAAGEAEIPLALGLTVETDGRLPTGQLLGEAITQVDQEASHPPTYYMINCAHPDHFPDTLLQGGDWTRRIKGLRANASRQSHAELDEAEELDAGNPQELGQQYSELARMLPELVVFGGCCGTDHRHIHEIALGITA